MRTTKYQYLSETMPIIAHNYLLLSYDSWLKNYHKYLTIIGNRFNLKNIGEEPALENKVPYLVPSRIKDIINNHADWSVEESLGFNKIL